jgi:hypothetical protein
MRDIFTLFLHAIVIVIRLGRPGGLRSVVAESVLMRHQVLILNRGRKRAPNLRASDRIIAGLCTLVMGQARVLRSAIVLKPSTLLHFHKMLTRQKYRLLFSLERVRRPGPKGPTKELIDAVVEMKRRNRTWGCKRIALCLPEISKYLTGRELYFLHNSSRCSFFSRHSSHLWPRSSGRVLPSGSRTWLYAIKSACSTGLQESA